MPRRLKQVFSNVSLDWTSKAVQIGNLQKSLQQIWVFGQTEVHSHNTGRGRQVLDRAHRAH